ncbi:hypothetical protein PCANC_22405, partial [Puccinia coronata f. sp. avenae]
VLEAELEALQEGPTPLSAADDDHQGSQPQTGGARGQRCAAWYPFKSKMELVGSLIMGHTHSLISRSVYSKIRAILTSCNVNLPAWATIQASRKRIRTLLDSQISYSSSPFGTPTFALRPQTLIAQDLANPLIAKEVDFYPESSDGTHIYKFSQSTKWLKGLEPAHQPQMCEVKGKHFYLLEPVQLDSSAVVIPFFFFMHQSTLNARCLEITGDILTQDGLGVTIKICKSISFDDAGLSSIAVGQFDRDFSEILLGDGLYLIDQCGGQMLESNGIAAQDVVIPIPNPWRAKAKGWIIRHVPITLYADDTSGNISKQFNNHVSFFFTLSGLPPHLSNQEYNCHFLSTSNVATVLEISEQIVNDINMVTEGFTAYDCSLRKPVLVTSVVLCFLADSPMHAEVTNTPNPGASNHPCRMCKLSVEKKKMRKSLPYVRQFIQCPNPPRRWLSTIYDTYRLFEIAMTISIAQYKVYSTSLGVKDAINTRFVTEAPKNRAVKEQMGKLDLNCPSQLYNPFLRLQGFDGVKDTPVEVLHVVLLGIVKYLARDDIGKLTAKQKAIVAACLNSLDTSGLNWVCVNGTYLIKHIRSIVGRHFKQFLQAAPFIFMDFVTPERRQIWLALCNLTPLIFQTKISNMSTYIADLRRHINLFVYLLIQSNAQWINKPKIHMLLHLPESIERFGPASLFSTEEFESYNGVLRQASIHSNRQLPGRDMAVTFDNYATLKFVVSGGIIYNASTGQTATGSEEVQKVFSTNFPLQWAMGYNHLTATLVETDKYPFPLTSTMKDSDKQAAPAEFTATHPASLISQVKHLGKNVVGKAHSLWSLTTGQQAKYYIKVQGFELDNIDPHYQMRVLSMTASFAVVHTSNVLGTINLQHNCHRHKCPVEATGHARVERKDTGPAIPTVRHCKVDDMIINLASLSNAELHCIISDLPMRRIQPSDWVTCVREGYSTWAKLPNAPEDEETEDDSNNKSLEEEVHS